MKEEREATILNVDDNEAGRYATTRVLRKAGYRVVEAATGAEVMERLDSEPVDLVVLDINLPDTNGMELCARIKSDPRFSRLPILHLTATYVMSLDRLQDSCADGYLMQPIEPAALIANIRALLRAAEAERSLRVALGELQSALDSLEDAVCVMGTNREVIQTNASFEQRLSAALTDGERPEAGSQKGQAASEKTEGASEKPQQAPEKTQGAPEKPRRLHGLDELLQQKGAGGRASTDVTIEGVPYRAELCSIKGAARGRARQVIIFRPGTPS